MTCLSASMDKVLEQNKILLTAKQIPYTKETQRELARNRAKAHAAKLARIAEQEARHQANIASRIRHQAEVKAAIEKKAAKLAIEDPVVWVETKGKLSFSEDRDSPYACVVIDSCIAAKAVFLAPLELDLILSRQAPHISFVCKDKVDHVKFAEARAAFQGKEVTFLYKERPTIYYRNYQMWVRSPELDQLREAMGLSKQYREGSGNKYHITLGRTKSLNDN